MMVTVLMSKFYLIKLKEHEDNFFSFRKTPSTQCLMWNGFKQTSKNIADLDCDIIEKCGKFTTMLLEPFKKRV